MELDVTLPQPVQYILNQLKNAGFEAYVVGGAVRDILRLQADGQQPDPLTPQFDYDFTTNARPEQILEVFPDSFYENSFGTVSITHQEILKQMGLEPIAPAQLEKPTSSIIDIAQATKIHESLAEALPEEHDETALTFPNYEITTFRSESAYEDHRRPSEVSWGETLAEDLQRRDFTINAMALDGATLIDPHHGYQDLQAGLIRTVGQPQERFAEDALRMLRAVRFSVQLNMQIEDQTFEAILQHADTIRHISWERIRDEFMKMLKSDWPAEGITLLDDAGLLPHILPELLESKGVRQGGHHTTDVWTHSLDALAETPAIDPIVRLATLLHDIAKPRTYKVIDGQITFYNHEIVGARMARSIARRLRLSKKNVDRVYTLVRYHMFHYQPHNTDAAIRRFMRKVGLANLDDILDLREGDRLGSGARRTSWRLEEMKQRMIDQLHQPMEIKDLAIGGQELMTNLGMQPGPEMGQVLNQLFEQVLENPELNTKEALLERAKELLVN